jgi:hypothetical protein
MHVRLDTGGTLIQSTLWSQTSAGVAGSSETGDHFGAAVTESAGAVGVPGKDIGKLKDAGSVQTFGYSRTTEQLVPSVSRTQNSPGVPGTAEAGDRFGAVLSEGIYECPETEVAAVGSPGEDIGKIKDAGSVTLLPLPAEDEGEGGCPSKVFSEGSGLPGTPKAGDDVGAALGKIPGDPDADEDYANELLIGVPGRDVGKIKDAGVVYAGLGAKAGVSHLLSGDVAGVRYGSVFPS